MGERLPTVEELLQQAQAGGGWSKFAPHADDIERLVSGGVRQKTIEAWLSAQGIKCARGELSHWLSRRRMQRAKHVQVAAAPTTAQPMQSQQRQLPSSGGEVQPAPALTNAAASPEKTSGRPMRTADERSGTSAAELDMEAKVAAAIAEAHASKGRRSRHTNAREGA